MATHFTHRLDAEEMAAKLIKSTKKLHIVREIRGRGFFVIDTKKDAIKVPISEIKLADPEPKPVTRKTYIGTIDCTPTWTATLPVLLVLLEDGSAEGQLLARDELKKMAGLADRFVELQKGAAA